MSNGLAPAVHTTNLSPKVVNIIIRLNNIPNNLHNVVLSCTYRKGEQNAPKPKIIVSAAFIQMYF